MAKKVHLNPPVTTTANVTKKENACVKRTVNIGEAIIVVFLNVHGLVILKVVEANVYLNLQKILWNVNVFVVGVVNFVSKNIVQTVAMQV